MPRAAVVAAGLLLYRWDGEDLWVLLVHPSGYYNRHKPWSLPKGLPNPGEELEAAARRETWEEAGIRYAGPVLPLGYIEYKKNGKQVHAFTATGPPDQEPHCASWEVDRAEYLPLAQARELLHPDQQPFLQRLLGLLKSEPTLEKSS